MSELQRYGLELKSDSDFVAAPMTDGYWTPWHLAERKIATLRQQLEQAQADSLQSVANKVCGELLEGWVVNLCMENGAAWVEAIKPSGYTIDIDGADLSVAEQVSEALSLADEIEKAGGES